jgi:hypothetical protein
VLLAGMLTYPIPLLTLFVDALRDAHTRHSVTCPVPIDLRLQLFDRKGRVAMWTMKRRMAAKFATTVAIQLVIPLADATVIRKFKCQNDRAFRARKLHEIAHPEGECPHRELAFAAQAVNSMVHTG